MPPSERFHICVYPTKIYKRKGNDPFVFDGILIRICDKKLSDEIMVVCIKDMDTVHGLIAGVVSERTGIPVADCEDLVGIVDKAFFKNTHTKLL